VTLSEATVDGALIAAGAAVVGFVAAFAGNILIERRRERRTARAARDQAIAEPLVAVVDLMSGIEAVRGAYQGQGGWRHYTRLSAVLLAAFGSEFASPAALSLDDVLDWRRLAPVFDRILAVDRDLDDRKRLVALDLATVLLPRTVRFYSAVAVLTLGSDKQIANAVRDLTPTVGRLMEVIAAKARTYERARARAEKALGQFPRSPTSGAEIWALPAG
jgi:hypothetical protein